MFFYFPLPDNRLHMKTHLILAFTFLVNFLSATGRSDEALQGPAWAREGVIYSVFPRVFSPTGDLPGVTAKVEELHQLGVTTLWLLPIHPIGEEKRKGTLGSPYSIRDYYAIDPAYGTKEDFKRLVARAHQVGMKIIMDAVLNHTAWDSVLMKYPAFYLHKDGEIIPPVEDWSDVAALNYQNPDVRAYMIKMLKYWVQEFNIDGFRFDAASMIPLDFWEEVRTELHQIKPDIFLLGEEDVPEALVKAFDMDYAWKFEAALTDILMKGASATPTLKAALEEERVTFPRRSWHLRFSDNHDKERAVVRFGKEAALAASALIFTLDGIPLLYNGMEVGSSAESHPPALFDKVPIF
jgi:cyclomaltodextrinase